MIYTRIELQFSLKKFVQSHILCYMQILKCVLWISCIHVYSLLSFCEPTVLSVKSYSSHHISIIAMIACTKRCVMAVTWTWMLKPDWFNLPLAMGPTGHNHINLQPSLWSYEAIWTASLIVTFDCFINMVLIQQSCTTI